MPMQIPSNHVQLYRQVLIADWIFAACIIVGQHINIALNPSAMQAKARLQGEAQILQEAKQMWLDSCI